MGVKFDATARRAIDLAMVEVERRGHSSLDSLHLLYGLIEAQGNVVGILRRLGADPDTLRRRADQMLGTGAANPSSDTSIEVSGTTNEVLERASNICREGAAEMVCDTDILRALIEREDTAAARLLKSSGITTESVEREIGTGVRVADRRTPGGTVRPVLTPAVPVRVGIGYDSHRFAPDGPLRLGGVDIPHHAKLSGHSDGDAVVHALTDAVLGAAALGDIGEMFPDTDPANRGRDSMEMLRAAVARVHGAGLAVAQVDITVIAEQPKLAPYRAAMRDALGVALGIPADRVGLKGKTNEGMGWVGRNEGIACMAVAVLVPSA